MKVLHINTNYTNNKLHSSLIMELESNNIQNIICVPAYKNRECIVDIKDNVHVLNCFKKRDRLCFQYKQKKIYNAINKSVNINNIDIIHAHTVFTDGNCAYKLHQEYGLPYIVAVRNTDVNTFFKYMIHLRKRGIRIMENAEAVIFLSKSYKNILLHKFCNSRERNIISRKSFVIPNGVDDFWFEHKLEQKREINKKSVRLVYAGKINKNKNIIATVQAMDELRKKYDISSRLTIVGKVEDEEYFELIMKNSNIVYEEAKPKEELIDYYRKNDIFVMPSKTETFGLVYAEAMTQGLPILYTKGQGFDGQFKEGSVGYRVDSENPEDIADRILDTIRNYDSMATNAVIECDKFQWPRIAKKYKKLYQKVLK